MDSFGEKIGIVALAVTMVTLGTSPHPFILILCYIIHELGHLCFSKLAGAKMRKLKIGALHLSLSYDTSSLSYKREMLVQLGGVVFNLLFAFFSYLFGSGEIAGFFVTCNLSLALMNLYPISILDGGGILKNIFLMILPRDVSEKLSKTISFVCAVLMWLLAIYMQIIFSANLSLFIISVALLVELCFSFA